jgi:uncharacterized membrane protein (DUF373 family)
MDFREEFRRERERWSLSTFYQNFERVIVYILTALIAIIVATATWRLAIVILSLVMADLVDPSQNEIFQAVFGAMFTVLIALEFRHSMFVTIHSHQSIVQVRSVILIALLALVRKFIILDVKTASPAMVGSIAAATLSLGVVYWLMRTRDEEEKPGD